ncbi:late blight resistance homolog R1A-3 isoform X1 [Olea europaea subsp. europaea]|uniref:Late blight resistance homolog R1A-3 isoform X1 n=1 Tax=Olea europaea subsp. europaea TaxID=158383 RepID=A0A8S0T9F1_OLEEU|nr:late blight resistance homolog R1A-3 isoform X1 [Olea europaea subsp. europaea]
MGIPDIKFGQELKVFFTVPNQQIMSLISLNLNPNLVVAAFINFHLLMVEVILYFKAGSIARVKGSIQNLQTERGFLMTFLGDTAMHLQHNKNLLTDIEAIVKEVGRFLYFFFFTIILLVISMKKGTGKAMTDFEAVVNEVGSLLHIKFFNLIEDITLQTTKEEDGYKKKGIKLEVTKKEITESEEWDLALSNLLTKFELLKTKIKEHCIAVSKMPSDMTPKTLVVSLFIVDSVLDDLMDLINNKPGKIIGVEDQIATLHKELMSLGSSVTDMAGQEEAEHEELMIQMRDEILQMSDIVYEVEYVINSFPHVWYLTLRLPQLIEKIQLIKMAIKDMKNSIDVAGIPEVAKYQVEQVSSQSTKYHVLGNIVVGFEKVANEILEQLVRGLDHLEIISIFGMPGLGKTTLASKLYNDPSVVDHFDKRSWCVVSQTYNKKILLIEILSSMDPNKRETFMHIKAESLVEKLYKTLKELRYLIVIDDIWDINVCNDLKRYFPNDKTGSRILFTTRYKDVGSKASPHSVINALSFLSAAECWELLKRKLFEDKNCPQELLNIGQKIATSCHGLPLAVVVIAAVFANVGKKEHLWQEVDRNLSSHISDNPNKFMKILELSHEHLPNHLKQCFIYFGAFEEDEEIPVRKLISLWKAEGFIKKEDQKCLEDVALEYLMHLIDRSLVLVSKRSFDREVKTCNFHDLLREMCLRIGEEKNFLKVVKFDDDYPQLFLSQVCMYQHHHSLRISESHSRCSLPFGLHMRSLRCHIRVMTTLIPSSFKVLSALEFRRSRKVHIVIGIENLVHLKYLAISGELPPMESFHKLEFLYVDNSNIVEIPDVLLAMMSLRHMHFRGGGCCFSESIRGQATKEQNFQLSKNIQSMSVIIIFDETTEKILRCCTNLHRVKCRLTTKRHYSFDSLNHVSLVNFFS